MKARTRIIGTALLVTGLASLLFTSYAIDTQREREMAHLRVGLEHTNQLLLAAATHDLKQGNLEQLNTHLDNAFRNPDLVQIRLTADGDRTVTMRERPLTAPGELIHNTIAITSGLAESATPLGELHTVFSTANLDHRLQQTRWVILSFAALLVLALLVAIDVAARGSVRSTRRLNRAVAAMAEGKFDQSIDGGGSSELESLSQSLASVQEKMAELDRDNRRLQAEIAQLRDAEQQRDRLISILEATTDIVGMADRDGNVIYINQAAKQMFGAGGHIREFHPERIFERLQSVALPAALENGLWTGETIILNASGEEIPVSQEILSHKDAQGNLLYFSTICRDISERQRTEQQLRASEATLKEAQRLTHIGSWELDLVNNSLSWSEEIFRIFEIDPKKFGASYEAFVQTIHPEDRELVDKTYRDSVSQRTHYEIEHRLLMPDGRIKHVHENGETYYDGDRPVRSIGTVQDITERKQAETALRDSETRLNNVMAVIGEGLWDYDVVSDTVRHNLSWCRMLKMDERYLHHPAADFTRLLHEDDRAQVMQRINRCLQGEGPYHSEHRMRRGDGQVIWVHDRGDVIERDAQGRALRMVGSFSDITERKQAEEELRQFKTTLDNTLDCVFMFDPQTLVFNYVNRGSLNQVGYTREELLTMTPVDIKPYFNETQFRTLLQPLVTGERSAFTFETVHRHKDGHDVPVEILLQYVADIHPPRYIAIVRDITERKQNEQALLLSKEQLERRSGMLEIVNSLTQRLHSTLDMEAVAQAAVDGLSSFTQSPHVAFYQAESATGHLRLIAYRGNNERFAQLEKGPLGATPQREMLVYAEAMLDPRLAPQLRSAMRELGMRSMIVLPLYYRDENLGCIEILFADASRLSDLELDTYRAIGRAVSLAMANAAHRDLLEVRVKQRTAQLATAKEEAERANRAKSDFLSRMSHELRTPLNAIIGFSQLLESEDVLTEFQKDYVLEILRAGRHLLDLINEVLDLARIEAGKLTVSNEPVQILPIIKECLTLIKPLADYRGVQITKADPRCGLKVMADSTRLKQVLLNLLSNAVKYNQDNGLVTILCRSLGDNIQIRISDTGAGLTPEQQSRLFQSFERLDADKQAIEGTGIGLALSKRLTELMRGSIGVESEPGTGSTFWVQLPAAKADAAHPEAPLPELPPEVAVAPARGTQWNVLCIEDNPANLRLIERIFARRQDIHLLSAVTPTLGLELAQNHLPALILLDINLPDMDGYAVMECLRTAESTRRIPVVAISANATPKDMARGKAAGFTAYLTKPLDVKKLVGVVDDIIGNLSRENEPDDSDLN